MTDDRAIGDLTGSLAEIIESLAPNYHLYSDTPENVDYRSVVDAVHLTEAVARRLASA